MAAKKQTYGSNMFRSKSMVYDQNITSEIRELFTEPEPKTLKEKWHAWPKTVFSIFGTEFCERFTFYGIKTVLTLYAINIMAFSDDNATVLLHAFTALAYMTPIFGSILADSYFGKYNTILSLSLLYACGNIVLSISAGYTKTAGIHPALDIVALVIIAFGTGGIKPCVSAFGADQFKIGQEKLLSVYFSVFYFSVNSGSVVSTILTPILRSQQCQGADSCYSLAFGVPAGLMLCACVIFTLCSFWYKKYPPQENVLLEVGKTVSHALSNRSHYSHVSRRHWLDHYLDDHECDEDPQCCKLGRCKRRQFVDDIKVVFKIIVMVLPCAMFWALFDQQGSRWLIQAIAMDNKIGNFRLLPDQMQVANSLMILCLIPVFQTVIYPMVAKCCEPTPLRKMAVGGMLTSLAFVVSAMVQFQVSKTMAQVPSAESTYLSFVNSLPCAVNLSSQYGSVTVGAINSSSVDDLGKIKLGKGSVEYVYWKFQVLGGQSQCTNLTGVTTRLIAGKSMYTTLTNNGVGTFVSVLEKSKEGAGHFKININYYLHKTYAGVLFLCADNDPCDPGDPDNFKMVQIWSNHSSDFVRLKPGVWNIWIPDPDYQWPASRRYIPVVDIAPLAKKSKEIANRDTGIAFEITGQGGIFTLTLTNARNGSVIANLHTIVPENGLNILWQLPQYAIMTASEIMFSVTGLEFSYSQAPSSMKSMAQAIWLLSVAFGDIIVMIVAEIRIFENLAYEMLLFAGLMFWDMIIFIILSIKYYRYANMKTRKESMARFPRTASRATMPSISEEKPLLHPNTSYE